MSEYTLYTHPQSRGIHVMWMLEECGADYTTKVIEYGEKMKSDAYLAVNPMGKVPALKHGEMILTETAAILLYLAEQFPEKKLIPDVGTPERGELYRLMFLTLHAEYAILDKYLGVDCSSERRKSIGYGEFEIIITTLKDTLNSKTYLIGDNFSVLDLYICGLLGWGINTVKLLSKNDAVFSVFLAKHSARSAFCNTMKKTKLLVEDLHE